MSVIFQTLQKMDAGRAVNASPTCLPSETFRWKESLKRLGPALVGFVTVLALGCIAVIVVQMVRHRVAESSSEQESLPTHSTHAISGDVPKRIRPQRKHEIVQPLAVQKTEQTLQAVFYPAETDRVTHSPRSPNTPDSNVMDQSEPGFEPPSAVIQDIVQAQGLEQADHMPEEATEQEAVQRAKAAEIERMRRWQQANIEKSTRTSQLVHKLEQALRSDSFNKASIDNLMAELSKIKGGDHPYVLKLKAYRLFKQGRYDQASAVYRRVTALNAEDLEAGINLALLEMRNNQHQKALDRLNALRDIYPEDAMIANLLKRVRR